MQSEKQTHTWHNRWSHISMVKHCIDQWEKTLHTQSCHLLIRDFNQPQIRGMVWYILSIFILNLSNKLCEKASLRYFRSCTVSVFNYVERGERISYVVWNDSGDSKDVNFVWAYAQITGTPVADVSVFTDIILLTFLFHTYHALEICDDWMLMNHCDIWSLVIVNFDGETSNNICLGMYHILLFCYRTTVCNVSVIKRPVQ